MMRQSYGNRMQSFGNKKTGGNGNGTLIILGVVILILAIVGGCYYSKPEWFANFGRGTSIKELDVLFFMSPNCQWCQKMLKVMQDENTVHDVTIIDVTSPEGIELAKKYGAASRGVPNFISKKLNTGTVGYKKTTRDVVNALTTVKKSPDAQKPVEAAPSLPVTPDVVQESQVILFTTENCPWCKKSKQEVEELGVMPYLELQDISTPQGKAVLDQLIGDNFRGVPTFFSKKTGKTAVGYRPFGQVLAMVQ